jgi:hypothetical protein
MVAVAVVGFFMHAGVARRKKAAGWLAGGWLAHGSLLSIAIVHARVITSTQCVFFREARSTRLGGGIYSRRLIRDFHYFR